MKLIEKYLNEVRVNYPTSEKQQKLKEFLLSIVPGKIYQAIDIEHGPYKEFLHEVMHARMHQSKKTGKITHFDVRSFYLNVKGGKLREFLTGKA